ncbi:MAG: carboxypeptidase-like regulatory domain-containing protein [Burkholderiales bacterium]
MRRIGWSAVAVLMAATAALAQGVPEKVITQGEVSYVSGGIGADSQERLQAIEKQFNLKLVFTLVEGNYLADVAVTVKDAKGRTVAEHVADGPFFMAKLPAGSYSVAASYEGKSQTRKVTLREGALRTEYLRWPSNPQEDLPVSRWLEPDEQPKPKK